MTEKEYRQHPAINRSALFKITESPEKFKYYMDNPEEPTPALLFGQLFHTMALQPEKLFEDFAVAPLVDRRTKDGKLAYSQFLNDNEGKVIIDENTFKTAEEMCKALKENSFVKKLFAGEKETPFFWTDEMTGEQCKCRTDVITEIDGTNIIVDLKSADNAETEAFTRSAIKYGYDLQAAMYTEGVQKNTGKKYIFVFVVIEKKPPYAINILQADELLMRRGYDIFRELIGIYHDCKQTNNWYGFLGKYNMINNLALPSYLAKEIE